MLIRSQEKNILTRFNAVAIMLSFANTARGERKNTGYNVVVFYDRDEFKVGKYTTEAKAIKVLDMIQEQLEENEIEKTYREGISYLKAVFQMPADEEVGIC